MRSVVVSLAATAMLHAAVAHAIPGRAYVTSDQNDTLQAIEGGTVVDTVAVGGNPFDVAVSLDGTRAYVANAADGTISRVDTATMNEILPRVVVSSEPNYVAVHPFGTRVYVTHPTTNTLSVINVTVNPPTVVAKVVTAIGTIGRIATVATNPVKVYVLHGKGDPSDKGELLVLDENGNALKAPVSLRDTTSGSLPTLGTPLGINRGPDATHVYVTFDSEKVSVVDTANDSQTTCEIDRPRVQAVAFTPGGQRMLISTRGPDSVRIFGMQTGEVCPGACVGYYTVAAVPESIAVSRDGTQGYAVHRRREDTLSLVDPALNEAAECDLAAPTRPAVPLSIAAPQAYGDFVGPSTDGPTTTTPTTSAPTTSAPTTSAAPTTTVPTTTMAPTSTSSTSTTTSSSTATTTLPTTTSHPSTSTTSSTVTTTSKTSTSLPPTTTSSSSLPSTTSTTGPSLTTSTTSSTLVATTSSTSSTMASPTSTTSTTASPSSTTLPRCGNGVIDPPDERCDPKIAGSEKCCVPDTCQPFRAGTVCGLENDACGAPVCDGEGTCVTRPALRGNNCRPPGAFGACDPGAECGVAPGCPEDDLDSGCKAEKFRLTRGAKSIKFRCSAPRTDSAVGLKCSAELKGTGTQVERARKRRARDLDAIPASDCMGAQLDTTIPKRLAGVSSSELARIIIAHVNKKDRAYLEPGKKICVRVTFTGRNDFRQTRLYSITIPLEP